MSLPRRSRLVFRDWFILKAMLDRCASARDPLMSLLKAKLSACDIVVGQELPPDLVTLDSRLVFSVNDGPPQTRVLVRAESPGSVGLTIPVATPRGLTLLGMGKGEAALVGREDGSTETVRVEDVLFQPDAAKWSARRDLAGDRMVRRPALKLIHSADREPRPIALRFGPGEGKDDPGPSAA